MTNRKTNLQKNCEDYFFCLTKEQNTVENFGMWAMYGKITEYDSKNPTPDKIGVKIQFTEELIDNLRNDYSLMFYAVGYANLLGNSNSKTVVYAEEIPLLNNILAGYIKDNAWKYENEFRLRSLKNNEKIRQVDENVCEITLSDEILKQLVVYPSPLSSVDECEKIFKDESESTIVPKFIGNKYENKYRFKEKN